MIIKVLMGQRKEEYPGQYGPEALEVMTEYDYDENPEWLEKQREKNWRDHWESIEIIDISVDDGAIMSILRPAPKTIHGGVIMPMKEKPTTYLGRMDRDQRCGHGIPLVEACAFCDVDKERT